MDRNIWVLKLNIFHIQRTFYLIDELSRQNSLLGSIHCSITFVQWQLDNRERCIWHYFRGQPRGLGTFHVMARKPQNLEITISTPPDICAEIHRIAWRQSKPPTLSHASICSDHRLKCPNDRKNERGPAFSCSCQVLQNLTLRFSGRQTREQLRSGGHQHCIESP